MTSPDEPTSTDQPIGLDEPIEAELVEPAAPSYEDVTGYTRAGVPTFDHVRNAINRRTATAIGSEELAHGTDAGQDTERRFAEREKAAKAKLEEIRRSLRE